jgi:hypothetical protein
MIPLILIGGLVLIILGDDAEEKLTGGKHKI